MIDISKFQFKTEVLGHTIRVIDQEGNDIVVIGSVQNPENITLANLFASAPEMYKAIKVTIKFLQEYILPNSKISNAEIGTEMLGIFDNPDICKMLRRIEDGK